MVFEHQQPQVSLIRLGIINYRQFMGEGVEENIKRLL